MKTLWPYIAFAIFVILVVGILGRAKGARRQPEMDFAYRGTNPLTEAEQVLYFKIREAVPECIILAQVALPALVRVQSDKNYKAAFNRIASKYVDFVVCLPDFTVVTVIELDDKSHTRPDRVRADTTKENALRLAGHPLLRFKVQSMPTVEQLRQAIHG